MSDCIFCKIIKKEIPSHIVYENEAYWSSKTSIPPLLIGWRFQQHIDNVCDPRLIEGNLLQSLFTAIQHVAKTEGLSENGFRVVVNYGRDAGEAVPHLHLHLLAGRKLNWPPG